MKDPNQGTAMLLLKASITELAALHKSFTGRDVLQSSDDYQTLFASSHPSNLEADLRDKLSAFEDVKRSLTDR